MFDSNAPIDRSLYNDEVHCRKRNEVWVAALVQAIRDSLIDPDTKVGLHQKARRDAINWFERADQDFRAVCLLAGFEPSKVKAAYDSGRMKEFASQIAYTKRY